MATKDVRLYADISSAYPSGSATETINHKKVLALIEARREVLKAKERALEKEHKIWRQKM